MANPYKILGQQIQAIRKNRDFTQEKLSNAVGISANYISKIEMGVKQPTLLVVKKIADAMGVSLFELFTENLEGKAINMREQEKIVRYYFRKMTPAERTAIVAFMKTLSGKK